MKVLIVCALIAAVRGTGTFYSSPVVSAGVINTGASTVHRSQDTLGQYSFGYSEAHSSGGTFRKEVGDAHGNKVGSYGLTDIDGRQRIVNYIADAAGFRADIRSNEQGVGATAQDPAHTNINKDIAVVAAAPVPVAVAAPAPVAISAPASPAAVVAAPVSAAEEEFELAQAVDSPLPYSAGVVATKSIASPIHYTAGVVATKAVATHVASPVHHAIGHISAPAHYGIGHYAAGIAGPISSHITHHSAVPAVQYGIGHYAAGIAGPISTHVTHHSAAPAPVSYSSSVHHGIGYAHAPAVAYNRYYY